MDELVQQGMERDTESGKRKGKRENNQVVYEECVGMECKEVIKAAECCLTMKCAECPLQIYSNDPQICRRKCRIDQLLLIRGLEAENKILRESCVGYEESSGVGKAIEKAFRSFFDKVKELTYTSSDWSHGEHPTVIEWDDIAEIYAEMVGDNFEGD